MDMILQMRFWLKGINTSVKLQCKCRCGFEGRKIYCVAGADETSFGIEALCKADKGVSVSVQVSELHVYLILFNVFFPTHHYPGVW